IKSKGAQSNEPDDESDALPDKRNSVGRNGMEFRRANLEIAAARKSGAEEWIDAAADGKTRGADREHGGNRESGFGGRPGGRRRTGFSDRGPVAQRNRDAKRAEVRGGSGLYWC